MILYPYQLSQLSNSIFCQYSCTLVYGSDYGMISAITQKIAKAFGAAHIQKYHYKYIKNNLSVLRDELSMLSLFADKRILIVEECSENFSTEIIEFLTSVSIKIVVACFMIFTACEVKKTSRVVSSFTNLKHAIVIPCYKPNTRDIQRIIIHWLNKHGLQYEAGVPTLLANTMPRCYMLIERALEKLALYKLNASTNIITITDIEKIFVGYGDVSLDELCIAFCIRDAQKVVGYLIKLQEYDVLNTMLILRMLQSYIIRLIRIKEYIDQGISTDQSILKVKPPIFFKYKELVLSAVNTVSIKSLLTLLAAILEIETSAKKLGYLTAHAIVNAIL